MNLLNYTTDFDFSKVKVPFSWKNNYSRQKSLQFGKKYVERYSAPSRLRLGKGVLACVTDGAYPIVGEIGKLHSLVDPVSSIPLCGIVNVTAKMTNTIKICKDPCFGQIE